MSQKDIADTVDQILLGPFTNARNIETPSERASSNENPSETRNLSSAPGTRNLSDPETRNRADPGARNLTEPGRHARVLANFQTLRDAVTPYPTLPYPTLPCPTQPYPLLLTPEPNPTPYPDTLNPEH